MEKQYQNLVRKFLRFQNGPAAEAMQKMGMGYVQNFGLALQQIKTIAAQIHENANFSSYLRTKDVREAQLISYYLQPISELSVQEANAIVEAIKNTEMVEQSVIQMFAKTDFAFQEAAIWSGNDTNFIADTGFILFSRLAITKKDESTAVFLPAIKNALAINGGKELHTAKAVGRALRQIALINSELQQEVFNTILQLKTQKAIYFARISDEVLPYIS